MGLIKELPSRSWRSGDLREMTASLPLVTLGETPGFWRGLIGYWPMTEGSSTTLYDKSENENNGTIYGASWSDGALDFNGTNDYVEMSSDTSLNLDGNSFTLSAWINGEGLADFGVFSKKGSESIDEWLQCSVKAASIELSFYGDDLSGSYSFSTGTWYLVTFKYDTSSNEQSVWVNGNKINSKTANGDLQNTNSASLMIGVMDSTSWANGKIDEARIYDRALFATEITDIYEKTRGLYGV